MTDMIGALVSNGMPMPCLAASSGAERIYHGTINESMF
jgi:hypothetical protein